MSIWLCYICKFSIELLSKIPWFLYCYCIEALDYLHDVYVIFRKGEDCIYGKCQFDYVIYANFSIQTYWWKVFRIKTLFISVLIGFWLCHIISHYVYSECMQKVDIFIQDRHFHPVPLVNMDANFYRNLTQCLLSMLTDKEYCSDNWFGRGHISRSTLAPVRACCLMAPSHYLNHGWLVIKSVLWHSL